MVSLKCDVGCRVGGNKAVCVPLRLSVLCPAFVVTHRRSSVELSSTALSFVVACSWPDKMPWANGHAVRSV